jgi:hypothetical protein
MTEDAAHIDDGTTPPVSDWHSLINKNSGKCVDARAAGTSNGTAIQQYTCNGTTAQSFRLS